MPPLKLSSKLPDDERNGLLGIAGRMRRDGTTQYLVIGLVTREELHHKDFTGEDIPKARFVWVEVVTGGDVEPASRLLTRARDLRQRHVTLPLALQLDLEAVFQGWPDDEDDDPDADATGHGDPG